MLRVRLFGPLRVEVGGREVPPPSGARARALLAWLALHPGRHPRARLAPRFWPDVLDESARASLRKALSDLRRALGEEGAGCLEAERDLIGIPAGPDVWVDARAFEELVAAGSIAEAAALCEGELLADFGDEWAIEARDEHRERLAELLGRLAAEALERGRGAEAVTLARRRAALDPLSEEAGRELIATLAAVGDRPAALAAYERLRERLAAELRLAPSVETTRLAERVRSGEVEPLGRATAGTRPPGTAGAPASPAAQAPPRPPLPGPLARLLGDVFVGRTEQLDQARDALRQSGGGARQVLVIAGEAGMGKSRLVAEACSEAHLQGSPVLFGRCYEDSPPYEPFVEALRTYLADADPGSVRDALGPGAEELGRLVPELSAPGDAARAPVHDPDSARYRLFDAVDSMLVAIAAGEAVPVLALDDLHWADPATLVLLRHLARSPRRTPLLLLLTYRLGEAGPNGAAGEPLPELRGVDALQRLALRGLDPAGVAAVAAARTGIEAGGELAGALHARTAGNPFFVEQLLRRLGELRIEEPERAAAAIQRLEVPGEVQEVIERRLRHLDQGARRVLVTAAAIGPEFTLALLEEAGAGEWEELLEALEAALASELVRELPGEPGAYGFAHALVRETLYEGTSAARRAHIHARLAEALERRHGEAPEHLTEIAHHLLAAGPSADASEKAARFAALAGEVAMSRLAYEDAAAELGRALAVLTADPEAPAERRAELLVRLGEAKLRAFGLDDARPTFAEGARLARAAGEPEALARAALGYGGLAVTILEVDRTTVELLEQALATLGEGDSPLRARLLGRLAVELYYGPSRERSEALSAEAVALARRLGDGQALTHALNARHVSLWRPDRLDDRLAIAREMVEVAQRCGDREGELQGRNWLVTDLFEAGELEAMGDAIDEYERLSAEAGLPAFAWYAPQWRGAMAMLEGRFVEGQRLAARARELGTRAADANAELLTTQLVVIELVARGAPELVLERYPGLAVEKRDSPAALSYAAGWAWFLAASDPERAREQFELVARDAFSHLPFDVNWVDSIGACAEACYELGDAERAAVLYELLLPYADRHGYASGRALISWGSVQRPLGMLCVAMGRLDEAAERFQVAIEADRARGWPPWVAWGQLRYAQALRIRDGSGDRERAAELLAAAAETAGELGLDGLSSRIVEAERPAATA